jgi:hypothetical protein
MSNTMKPGCKASRFGEPVTVVSLWTSSLGQACVTYRQIAYGSAVELDGYVDELTHRASCPCAQASK